MSGFAPPPSDGVTPLLTRRSRESQFEYVLQRIASGEEKQPQLAAKVALGELPIGALLASPDTDVFCMKCHNKGRTTKGQGANAGQRFGCPGCGYLEGEHPNRAAAE